MYGDIRALCGVTLLHVLSLLSFAIHRGLFAQGIDVSVMFGGGGGGGGGGGASRQYISTWALRM